MRYRCNRTLLWVVSLMLVVHASIMLRAQTFEQPVSVVQDPQMFDWFTDLEVNPADATVDLLYTT